MYMQFASHSSLLGNQCGPVPHQENSVTVLYDTLHIDSIYIVVSTYRVQKPRPATVHYSAAFISYMEGPTPVAIRPESPRCRHCARA